MKRKMMSLLLALAVISGSSVYAKVIDVMSPNGAIKVSVDIKDRIYYSVSYDNDQLLKDCYLNLQLQNETLGTNPHLRSTKRGTIDESVKREIPFKNAIDRVISRLSATTARIFLLSRYDNKSHKEIAEIMGMTVKGVEFHISKATKELRVALKDYLVLFPFLCDFLSRN